MTLQTVSNLLGGTSMSSFRLAALITVLGACADLQHTAPGGLTPAGPAQAADPKVPVVVVDVAARFPTVTVVAGFAIDPDGTLFIAEGRKRDTIEELNEGPPTSAVVALDEGLATRWRAPIPHAITGLLALGARRLLVASGLTDAKDTELRLLDDRGATIASNSFRQLVGEACTFGNRYWLASEANGYVAYVGCNNKAWLVHVTSDLRTATRELAYAARIDAPQTQFEPAANDLTVMHRGRKISLVPHSSSPLYARTELVPITPEDVIVAASVLEPAGGDARPRFASGAFVTRMGGSATWRTELIARHASNEYEQVFAAAVAPEAVMVAIEYHHDGRLAGVTLPPPAPAHPVFPDAFRGIAVAELDRETGATRAVLALRPAAPWKSVYSLSLGASRTHLVIATADEIWIYPRRGATIPPPERRAAAAAPPVPVAVPAVDATRLTPLVETWADLCGPRTKQKRDSPCRLATISIGKDGTIAAGGGYYGANQFGSRPLPRRAYKTGVIAVYERDGRVRWQKEFGVSWHNQADQLLVRDDNHVVLFGTHGQGFAIDGTRLPDRQLRKVAGQDMAFEAATAFVAVFDPAGKLELLEDLDVLALGDRSTAIDRTCAGTIAQGNAADEVWVLARCPRGAVRFAIRGIAAQAPTAIGPVDDLQDTYGWIVDARGRAFVSHGAAGTVELFALDGIHGTELPLIADASRGNAIATSPAGTWFAGTSISAEHGNRLVLARVDAALSRVTAHELGTSPQASISALAIDDEARPIVAIQFKQPITIGGQTLQPEPSPDKGGEPGGLALVRFVADGSRIDRVFSVAAKRSCIHPGLGLITAISARAGMIAITLGSGLDPTCGLRDEPSTVMVFPS